MSYPLLARGYVDERSVGVRYAGSLVTPMEGAIVRAPDIFISAVGAAKKPDSTVSPKRAFQAVAAGKGPLPTAPEMPGRRNGPGPAQIYPEERRLARLETGEADVGFLYSTEAIPRHIPYMSLPGKASLSGEITYTLAVMKAAPHPRAAERFATFILQGDGRRTLERAGITYLP